MKGSGRPEAPWRVLATRTTVLVLVAVGAFEALLHMEPVRDLLPPPRIYYTNHVEPRLRALRATLRDHGRVDVLFVGSSIVRTNLRPFVFDSVVAARAGRDVVSFNGGLSGLPPDGVLLYLERFFLPRGEPRHVLQGIRYPELLRSTPASDVEALSHGVVEPLWIEGGRVDLARAWAVENVGLLRYRGALGRLLGGRGFPPVRFRTYAIDARGWNLRDTTLAERVAGGRVEIPPPHPGLDDPGALEAGVEILRRTARTVRSRGGEYVLVNVPEHGSVYGSRAARQAYRAYLERLKRFAAAEGIPFVDVTGGDPDRFGEDRWFFDAHHMTGEGARRFTEEVARAWLRSPIGAQPPWIQPPRAAAYFSPTASQLTTFQNAER